MAAPMIPEMDNRASSQIEGIARVVAIEGQIAWLEPEQTTSCGHCASAQTCGTTTIASATGIGTLASRIQARRFPIGNPDGPDRLQPGDRVLVSVRTDALIKAAVAAYAVPIAFTLTAGGIAQAVAGSDHVTQAAMAGGLVLGLAISRLLARRLAAQGKTAPRFVRRIASGLSCHPD